MRMKTIHTFINLEGRGSELMKESILSKKTTGLKGSTHGRLSLEMVLAKL